MLDKQTLVFNFMFHIEEKIEKGLGRWVLLSYTFDIMFGLTKQTNKDVHDKGYVSYLFIFDCNYEMKVILFLKVTIGLRIVQKSIEILYIKTTCLAICLLPFRSYLSYFEVT